jgi:RNA-directed DNA polymerase
MKQPNESGKAPEEVAEGRPLTKENTSELNPCRTPCRESGHSGLERVREAASKDGKLKFTALLHHLSIDLLRESYYSLKRKAAPGVVTRGAATQSILSRIRSAFGCATGQ